MPLPRHEIEKGLTSELSAFSELVRSLSEQEWGRPTCCEGWTVADIAAHLAGTMVDVVEGRLEGLGTPEVTEREVVERRGRTPEELASELDRAAEGAVGLLAVFDDAAWDGPIPSSTLSGTVGSGVEALWYDAFVHGNDIRAAIGRPAASGDGVRAAVSHVAGILTDQQWGPATLALDGLEQFPVSGGGSRVIEGEPLAFVAVATGRADPRTFDLDDTVNIYR